MALSKFENAKNPNLNVYNLLSRGRACLVAVYIIILHIIRMHFFINFVQYVVPCRIGGYLLFLLAPI